MILRALRELRGISRKDLAKAAGISFRSIQDYEQGHKSLSGARADTVLRMARALNCSMEALLTAKDLSQFNPDNKGSNVSESEVSDHSENLDSNKALAADDKEAAKLNSLDLMSSDRPTSYASSYEGDSKPPSGSYTSSVPSIIGDSDDELSYILMHKDLEVARVVMEPYLGGMISLREIFKSEWLPYGVDASNLETASLGLKSWWQRRAVPITQGSIRRILWQVGFETPQAYLLKTLGLSMEDCYWIKPARSDELWKDVSFFQNEFEDIIGAMHFGGLEARIDFHNFDVRFPSASTGGDVPKAWVCLDGDKRLLVKGSKEGNTQQVFNEVVASYIHRKQGMFPFVDYQFYNIDYGGDSHFGISSEAFTSEELEFIPASELIFRDRGRDKSDYDKFVDACVEGGLSRDEVIRYLDYQILTDFVITNTDRSYGNFGVLRSADKLSFVSMAPFFDSGNSMFYDLDMSRGTLVLKNIPVDSFMPNEVGLLRLVKDPDIVDLDRFLTDDEMREVLHSSKRTNEEIRLLLAIYNRKKGFLAKLKRGDTRWMD